MIEYSICEPQATQTDAALAASTYSDMIS
jgi:hypothetical protein